MQLLSNNPKTKARRLKRIEKKGVAADEAMRRFQHAEILQNSKSLTYADARKYAQMERWKKGTAKHGPGKNKLNGTSGKENDRPGWDARGNLTK